MPNNPNARKAVRQTEKRRLRNRAARTSLKTVIRKASDAISGPDAAGSETSLRTAIKRIDQAAAKKLIHKNKAARLKSQLARSANKKK